MMKIGIEKTSFAKLGRGETVGRCLYLPRIITENMRYWKVLNGKDEEDDFIFRWNNRLMEASEASAAIHWVTERLTGKHIGAQTLRKLRSTHVLNLFSEHPGFDKVLRDEAEMCGHSQDIVYNSYWIKDPETEARASRRVIQAENWALFDD